jgi:GntR family transcriptional regulator
MLFAVNERDPRALFEQIISQIKGAVAEGKLEVGQSLPGVRDLADGLGVNLHTVHKAYQRLRDEGIIELRLGRCARVAKRDRPAGKRVVKEKVLRRLEEAASEAAMLGVSAQEFRRFVDAVVARKLEERKI